MSRPSCAGLPSDAAGRDHGDDDLISLLEDGSDDPSERTSETAAEPWRILVVDDDSEIHAVTRLALRRFTFLGRPVLLLSALSASEAERILRQTADIALVLLDVVMEQDDAGLRLVRTIRETLDNTTTRIILRTGQPGQAPEKQVIADYDINDYRSKTELTQDRLHACIISALRSYQHIRLLEESNNGMRMIVNATTGLFRARTMQELLDFALARLLEIAGGSGDAVFCARYCDHLSLVDEIVVVNGCGRWAQNVACPVQQALNADEVRAVEQAILAGKQVDDESRLVVPLAVPGRWQGAALIQGPIGRNVNLSRRIELFRMVMVAALENYYLIEELRRSRKATVIALADLAEHRDTDTGEHVLRVGRLSTEMARELRRAGPYSDQIDDLFLESIGSASMLHDLGKVGVPDAILRKPGRLDAEERRIMETHAAMGGQTLDRALRLVSGSRYLDLGRQTALAHHEWYDGTGYPAGLKGEAIPLAARIVAVADVFDALTSSRVYKPAWRFEDAVGYILNQAGSQFDPVVIGAFQTVMDHWQLNVHTRWTPDMSVGDAVLDEDHRRLIRLVNQLAGVHDVDNRATLESVLDELVQYTDAHFRREEEHLRRIGFPHYHDHKKKHDLLGRQVTTLRLRFFNGLPGRLNDDVITFLGRWLSSHILIEDMQYRAFLDSQDHSEAEWAASDC